MLDKDINPNSEYTVFRSTRNIIPSEKLWIFLVKPCANSPYFCSYIPGTSGYILTLLLIFFKTYEAYPYLWVPPTNIFLYIILKFLFIFKFLSALGLCCCPQAFSSCGKQGQLASCGVWASCCGGFFCCKAQALGAQASAFVVHRLTCHVACGIFLDQGLNPCPLHWQVNS